MMVWSKLKYLLIIIFFSIFDEISSSLSRGMQWLCIPSNVSMERREHEAMNGWLILLLKLDRLFLQHRKNLLEEMFFSSFTVIHTEWASDSSYEEYGDNDYTFRMDTILISTKKIHHNIMSSMPRILVSAHPTSRTIPRYSVQKKKKDRIFSPEPESWRIKIKFLLIFCHKKIKNF